MTGIREKQGNFIWDAGTQNTMFMIIMISERSIMMQTDVNWYFIVPTKHLIRQGTQILFEQLVKLNQLWKYVRIYQNIYQEDTACIRIEHQQTGAQKQKNVFSHWIYSTSTARLSQGIWGFYQDFFLSVGAILTILYTEKTMF